MNDVMLPKPVKTHEKQLLGLIGTDNTDLKGENSPTADQRGLPRIEKIGVKSAMKNLITPGRFNDLNATIQTFKLVFDQCKSVLISCKV
jgi:hypothetical protein